MLQILILGAVVGELRSILEVELRWRKWVKGGGVTWEFYSRLTSCLLSVSHLWMQWDQLPSL